MKEFGLTGAKASQLATFKTRRAKNISRSTLDELWEVRAKEHNVDTRLEAKQAVETALHRQSNEEQTLSTTQKQTVLITAKEAVHNAILHLSETEVAIEQIKLINTALNYVIGEVKVNDILRGIEEARNQGELILLKKTNNQIIFTSKQLIEYEQAIIKALEVKNTKPLLSLDQINGFLSEQTHLIISRLWSNLLFE